MMKDMTPEHESLASLVSIVVISYNDAGRLPRALAALQHQTHHQLEIIVVDDASTDETEAAVAAIAALDPRVRYVRLGVNSGGCSAPRNRGLEEATGFWVMFCDSDDEYSHDGVAALLRAAMSSQADIGCGVAERFYLRESRGYPWRADLHEPRIIEGIMGFPDLIGDTISVNKIYRRSWLMATGIRFPEGLLYEDQLFTIEAFAAAGRIVVIPDVTYRWNVQAGSDSRSITQQRTEIRNVSNRVEINRRIDSFLAGAGLADLQRTKDIKFLDHDLIVSLGALLEMDDQDSRGITSVLSDYVGSLDLSLAEFIRPAVRVAVYHLLRGDIDGIRHAVRYVRWSSVVDVGLCYEEGRVFWGDPEQFDESFGGFDSHWWLDVTDLNLWGLTFPQQRLCHLLEVLRVEGDLVTVEGTTVDAYDCLDEVDTAEFVLVQGSNAVILSMELNFLQVDARNWRWHGSGVLAGSVSSRARLGHRGFIGIRLSREGEQGIRAVRFPSALAPRVTIALPGPVLGRSAGLAVGPSRRGTLEWRAPSTRIQRGIAAMVSTLSNRGAGG